MNIIMNVLMKAQEAPVYDSTQLMIGLVLGVLLLVFLVVKTKVHAFMALIISAMVVALIGGVNAGIIPSIITKGFGSTLGSIGIIIGLGVIMGQIFETSGAAERMALTFIKLFGKGREELALAVTGFIVSIPVFCDSAFVILFPIAKAISQKTRKNLISLGGALALGLVLTHTLVPPTPGPLAVAQEFGIDLGSFILLSLVTAIPMLIAGMIYVKYFADKKLYLAPTHDGKELTNKREAVDLSKLDVNAKRDDLPSTFLAFLPIFLPIFLILVQNVLDLLVKQSVIEVSALVMSYVNFFGNPVVAVSLGTLIAIYTLARNQTRKATLRDMDRGIASAGIILLVTGAGGALGQVIKDTGLGTELATMLSNMGIPLVLLPFVIATLVRFVQGSGTVALITSASISAPIVLAANASGANINVFLAAIGACIGGIFFSYFNDSYFHVVNRSIGIEESKDQIQFWSFTTTAAWLAGLVIIVVGSLIF